MLDETKTIIELAYFLTVKIAEGLKDIKTAGPGDFFKCLYYDREARGEQPLVSGAFYKVLKNVSGGGTGPLVPVNYYEGTSYTVWAVDFLEAGGDLNQILITFDGTSKQLLIEKDIIRVVVGEPVR